MINNMKIHEHGRGQANQDSFVLNMLNEKRNGIYVEIGAWDPFLHNNTYLLESEYDWSGVSFDIVANVVEVFNKSRKNKCIQTDATKFDYLGYFKENNYPEQIDYLQLDIDPAKQTLEALYKLPTKEYRFSVITYEHDLYVSKDNALIKYEAMGVLKGLGYKMVAENVTDGISSRQFEDWWIDPNIVKDL